MAALDIDSLHRLTLDDNNQESGVTVNQRALIDKVLSRYSSENTLLRELMQNADDANATKVRITYNADKPWEDPNKALTKRVVVRNNGHVFRAEDWTRLARIAEGNPDESKIGAFGVGFYSVFSICEDPFVTSGDTGLAFYWKGDQLFTRRAKLPQNDEWTNFALKMREPQEIPNLRSLTKFLATSLTFSRSLAHIELYLDDLCLCTLKRVASPTQTVEIKSALATTTAGKMMRITDVDSTSVQISATYINATQTLPPSTVSSRLLSFFSSGKQEAVSVDLTKTSTSNIFLRIITGHIQTSVSRQFAAELLRATKKPLPARTKVSIVVSSAAEHAASSGKSGLFEDLLCYPSQGRVYIGFPTHQTTGFSGHIGAPCLIPTVERESIDLVDRWVKIWNFEVLRAIGLLTRIAYHVEFVRVSSIEDAVHTMKFFSMKLATPQRIDLTVEEAFFGSSGVIPLFSTCGVRPSNEVRLQDADITFLKDVPLLPKSLQTDAADFIGKLRQLSMIESVNLGDIRKDVADRLLSLADSIAFLRYCAKRSHDLDSTAWSALLNAAVGDGGDGTPVSLGSIRNWSSPKVLPAGVPMPPSCAPQSFTSVLSSAEINALGWEELPLIKWLDYCVSSEPFGRPPQRDINKDEEFAVQVLAVMSKGLDSMGKDERDRAIQLLQDKTCIPTRNHGMLKPSQTYLYLIRGFDDLPVIGNLKGVKEKFLVQLGVRKTIELDIIFDKLSQGGKWSAIDLVQYLASVRRDMPAKDVERLRSAPFAAAEGADTTKRSVVQLYEPNDTLRSLNLPVLAWPADRWRPLSTEANLLFELGLKRFPTLAVLLQLCAHPKDEQLRERALAYLLTNFNVYGYAAAYDAGKIKTAFVPTSTGKLRTPRDVFTMPACEVFGFDTIRRDLLGTKASMLGIAPLPPFEKMLEIVLTTPPQTFAAAQAQFAVLGSVMGSAMPPSSHRDAISRQTIIPIFRNEKLVKLAAPSKTFFRGGATEPWHEQVFDMVDFGPQANSFLRNVGVRDRPTTAQLAEMLVAEPANVFRLCSTEDKYRDILAQIARDLSAVKGNKALWMRMANTAFLLADKYKRNDKALEAGQDETVSAGIQTSLQRASDILIVDSVVEFQLFRQDVWTAPQDSLLESLYTALGAVRLSSVVQERTTVRGAGVTNDACERLKAHLLERLPVFFHSDRTTPARDVRWVEKKLRIVQYDGLSLQRTLVFGGVRVAKTSPVTAFVDRSGPGLCVTANPDDYDVAEAVCNIVLSQPTSRDYLLLTSMLQWSVSTLQKRGFNVDRILQRRERERKEKVIQEEHERQERERQEEQARQERELEAQRQKELALATPPMQAASAAKSASMQQQGTPKGGEMSMPGGFPSSPAPTSFGLLSSIRKGLGLPSGSSTGSRNTRPPAFHQPPIGGINPSVMHEQPTATISEISTDDGNGPPATAEQVERAIDNAVRSLRAPTTEPSLFSPPQVTQVREAENYCDASVSQALTLVLPDLSTPPHNGARGARLYSSSSTSSIPAKEFANMYGQAAGRFSLLLQALATQVFGCPLGSPQQAALTNVFLDTGGACIAFNRAGTVYCNLRYYVDDAPPELKPDGGSLAASGNDQLIYWFVTLAHELAHNLVKEHSAKHSFYVESIVCRYLPALITLMRGS
ncbi:hypothetical protein PYCC9005_004452 [Savitreella phatthalungensis]